MATPVNLYFYIESIDLTLAQRQTLVDVLKAWGLRNDSIYPNERNHWAVRPDNLAVIFEAVFDADNLTVLWFRTKLAQIFGVLLTKITATTFTNQYGTGANFSYNSVVKMRLGIFGGINATWDESHEAALMFLSDFKELWQGTTLP